MTLPLTSRPERDTRRHLCALSHCHCSSSEAVVLKMGVAVVRRPARYALASSLFPKLNVDGSNPFTRLGAWTAARLAEFHPHAAGGAGLAGAASSRFGPCVVQAANTGNWSWGKASPKVDSQKFTPHIAVASRL